MSTTVLCVLLFCAVYLKGCSMNDFVEFEKHMKLVKNFQCGTPKPVVYHWQEIIPEYRSQNIEKLVPPFTVLNKCGHRCGGCPLPNQVCQRKEAGISKKVTFHVYKKGEKKPEFLTVHLKEDISCHCISKIPNVDPIK